jgi:hypothetical protein
MWSWHEWPRNRQDGCAWLTWLAFMFVLAVPHVADRHSVATAAEAQWGRYRDPQFGLAFDFPAHIFRLDAAEQREDGIVFETPDSRARVRVFGFRNESNVTPKRYLRKMARDEAKFTYVRTTSRFFVVSGPRDGSIFYRRCNFFRSADKHVGCVELEYPEGEKTAWDDVVTRISLSLAAAE